MRPVRLLLSLVVLGFLVGVAYVSQATEPAGVRMVAAAETLVGTLTAEQKTKAVFAFDHKERLNWHFTPHQDAMKKPRHKGVAVGDMTAEQKEAAMKLLRAGTSAGGFERVSTIMSLEGILNDLEKGRGPGRNPGWYFFTVYGTPSKTGSWGWRVEGHHLSLNFTLDGGTVVSTTPALFGANPAVFLDGARKGQQVLPEAEDLAKEVVRSLDEEQKKVAIVAKPLDEVEEASPKPNKIGEPKGLPAARMTEQQRGLLRKLIEGYANRMPGDVAERELAAIRKAGPEKIHFAYNGGLEKGQPHTFRVQGPTFVIEFLNAQADGAGNRANHIHSAWRSLTGNDFGLSPR